MAKSSTGNDLLYRFRAGERQASREVCVSLYPSILLFVRSIVRNEAEAKDIVSEAFVRLWNRRYGFENMDHIRSFLYLTARHVAIDHIRSLQRRARSHEEIRYLSVETCEGMEREMINSEVFEELRSQVESLPPKCGQVLKLLFYEGKKAWEVAGQLVSVPRRCRRTGPGPSNF